MANIVENAIIQEKIELKLLGMINVKGFTYLNGRDGYNGYFVCG